MSEQPKRGRDKCSIDGCEKIAKTRGWCSMHYWRWQKHGDHSICTTNRGIPVLERFWMKVQKGAGCWQWIGGASEGYGQFTDNGRGKTHVAHRLSYELTVGPIPDGMQLDHQCRNTLCVNPAHLRPVTNKENNEHKGGANRNSSTGVLGVHQCRKSGRYVATVMHNRRQIYGGSFATLREAAEVAKTLRISVFTHNDADRRSA